MNLISDKAIIEEGAQIGDNVSIAPFTFVSSKAIIGDGTTIAQGACIYGKTTIGKNNRIFSHAVIGSAPQDLKYNGEDVELTGYSYFHEKLVDWMLNQINVQEDFGPLEPLNEYIHACDNPSEAIISIGAKRYTEFGKKTFLKPNDESVVIVYNHTKISSADVLESVKTSKYNNENMSVLAQKVI